MFDAARLVSRLGPVETRDPGSDPSEVRSRAIWSIFQEAGGAGQDLLEVMDTLLLLRFAREIADYDRVRDLPRAEAQDLIEGARRVAEFFALGTSRRDDPDARAFLALVALKAQSGGPRRRPAPTPGPAQGSRSSCRRSVP